MAQTSARALSSARGSAVSPMGGQEETKDPALGMPPPCPQCALLSQGDTLLLEGLCPQ